MIGTQIFFFPTKIVKAVNILCFSVWVLELALNVQMHEYIS